MPPAVRRALAMVTILVSAALVACVGPTVAGAAARDGAPKGPSGVTLAVGDQGQYLETVLRASGELDDVPYQVDFKSFLSGPLLVQGFNADQIDIGMLGDTPASGAVGAHVPVKAVAVSEYQGPVSSLVARPGIKSIAQLKGKKVAYTTGTAQHALALRAFKSAGLQAKDVEQVDVTLQQLGTVLEAGQADASVLSPADRIRYLAQHPDAKSLADNSTLKPATYLYVLATDDALHDKGKSAAVADFTQRLVNASKWANAHPDEWVQAYYVNVAHQDAKFASQVNAGLAGSYVPITKAVQQALQQQVDLLASQKAIPAPFDVSPLFDRKATATYNAIVGKDAP
jgi:sulfonate transport system substrate-binding protein